MSKSSSLERDTSCDDDESSDMLMMIPVVMGFGALHDRFYRIAHRATHMHAHARSQHECVYARFKMRNKEYWIYVEMGLIIQWLRICGIDRYGNTENNLCII